MTLAAFITAWLSLMVAFWMTGLHIWAILWGVILLAVLVAELVSKLLSGRTISQRFWAMPFRARVMLLLGMGMAWVFLLVHLGCRLGAGATWGVSRELP